MKAIIFVPLNPVRDQPDNFYNAHEKTAKETWDFTPHPDIKVVYVRLGRPFQFNATPSGGDLWFPSRRKPAWFGDIIDLSILKFARSNLRHGFSILSNASSYWNKNLLAKLLERLPERGCATAAPTEFINGKPLIGFLSGAGTVLSTDVIEYVLAHRNTWDAKENSDVALSRIVQKRYKFGMLQRKDYTHPDQVTEEDVTEHYHFRCKADPRTVDLEIMRRIQAVLASVGKPTQLCGDDNLVVIERQEI